MDLSYQLEMLQISSRYAVLALPFLVSHPDLPPKARETLTKNITQGRCLVKPMVLSGS